MGSKIIEYHARDLYMYGRGQPQGTCVLLKVLLLNSLVHYFYASPVTPNGNKQIVG